MKKVLCALLLVSNLCTVNAQLANGSTAPDFTFTDINGITQNLYSYLNAGKYVMIDNSTTWCAPCWAYHRTGVMDSLYTLYDSIGDKTAKVFFIEGDGGTDLADLQGTGTSTQGNWLSGTLFTVINPPYGIPLNDYNTTYNINQWPTFYLICPNKKVYTDTLNSNALKPSVRTWEYVASTNCAISGLDNLEDHNPLTIYPNPSSGYVVLYFGLNCIAQVKLLVSDVLGKNAAIKDFGSLQPGDHSLKFDVSILTSGIYFFTISTGNNRIVRKKVVIE
jgi:Secretion system C-terminal sorting domain